MAFTRYKYDRSRTVKELQESTDIGRFILNVPGNGSHPCFMENPSVRLQKWGANVAMNRLEIENDLLGINRRYSKCDVEIERPICLQDTYKTCSKLCTGQSRTTNPSWQLRDNESSHWKTPVVKQIGIHYVGHSIHQSSRLTEKDAYMKK
jgi:hypothetical protein